MTCFKNIHQITYFKIIDFFQDHLNWLLSRQSAQTLISLLFQKTLLSGELKFQLAGKSCFSVKSTDFTSSWYLYRAAGFTSAGIAAGSFAASAMSWTGVVGAGSVIAGLQSAGAAGIGITTKVIGASIGAGVGHMLSSSSRDDDDRR